MSSIFGDATTPSFYLFALPQAGRETVLSAIQAVFPDAAIHAISSFDEIVSAGNLRVVVIASTEKAADWHASHGATQTPRWTLVVLGENSPEFPEAVPPTEWQVPLLIRVFRAALRQQDLSWEIARLRGDVRTVARRVSHDLRTPVGCIYTSSDVLKELPPDDPEFVSSMAGIIKDSAVEISGIVDRVSLVLKASVVPSMLNKMDMGQPVTAALRELEKEIGAKGAQVRQPSSWPQVAGVSVWLQMIWQILLQNALHHSGAAPQIEMAWTEIETGYRFAVNDRGPPIPPERVTNLFAPFEELHALRVQGLGLSIVRRLVELQHGSAGYEKRSTGGASFYFTLARA